MILLKPFIVEIVRRWMICVGLGLTLCGAAYAATTDIANAPLFTSSADVVKPNVMFILDDSGSMASDYLPDEANFSSTKYGKLASQCNGVAYNPTITYELPVDSTGTTLAAGSLASITPNPITQTSNPRNLSAIAAMPASAAGTISVTVTTSNKRSSWYSAGDTVTVYQSGDSSRYITGTVVSWDTTTGVLVIDLSAGTVVGSGAMSSPLVGVGQTASATYYRYTGTQKKLSYTYTSSGVITTTTFYRECNSTIGSSPGNTVFTPVSVNSLSAEAQNYANWLQYYHTRITMMKSSMSLAFKGIDNRFRVGYSTISENTAVQGGDFVNIRDFDATQKASVYTAFNAAVAQNWTPLRGALSKAGQYYANKALSQTVDPMQYSCQRNFTILSTDGYWNTPQESTTAPKYGPYMLDNTTNVGQQDGSGTLRPMLDGNSVTTTTTSTWTSTAATITTGITPRTTLTTSTKGTTTVTPLTGYSRYAYTLPVKQGVSAITRPGSGCSTCTVTVTTSGNHGFSIGASITVTGGTVSGYTGTFTITGVPALNQLQYTASGGSRPASPSAASSYTVIAASAPAGAQSCSVGQGLVVRQEQRQDALSVTTSTSSSTTTTLSTVTGYTTTAVATPYRRIVVQTDGVTTSDNTTQGVFQTTNSTTATTSTSPAVTATSSTTAVGTGTFTVWTNFGAPTTTGSCTASLPSPNPSTATTVAPSTSATTTTTGPTITGPTTTAGTTTLSVGTTTTTVSPVVAVSSSVSTGGVSDTLADIAMYYYKTDLRTTALGNCTGSLGVDVCNNNVKGSASDARHSYGDSASWQHMTTFTLGLGVNGILTYDPNYLNQLSGDYFDILNGAKNWPAAGTTKTTENIDDLWHAAVNGRGQYFSAGDPSSLATSLNSALNSIKAITGSASAASTSSLQPVQGDNDIYLAKFTTAKWTGDIEAYSIDPSTGAISSTTTWTASALLDATAETARTIYYPNPSGGSTLRTFTYANLTTDSFNGSFDNFCSKTGASGAAAPAQCSTLSGADLTAANSGANLVSYLRGNQSLAYYRSRDHVLGDIINASPLYIGKPSFKYTENNYSTFAATSRTAVILAAANDGMLHAFDRITGNERWAYVPSFVMGKLYKLADSAYGNNHSFYVDGSPQMGDIFVGGQWKTIVVGGLNAGGRGYYALDVTNPIAPKLLWEFSANDLGLTFGNPIITKRADGTWVVVFASGYNNVSPGDGNGHLFVLDANTGSQLLKIDTFTSGSTPAGTSSAPSGLAKINAFVDSELNNQALRFYGGDLLGNLWRFDIDNLVAPNQQALLLAQLKLANGTPQGITTKPALAEVSYNNVKYPVVYAVTGRYLGTTDLSNTTTQTVYAIKDPMTNSPYGDIRASSSMVTQTITAAGSTALGTRTIAVNPVDWSTKSGWRADFPAAGERVNINPQLVLDTLYVGTNIPSTDTCTIGGSSFLYQFDISTGGVATGQNNLATYVGDVLIQGITTVQLAGSDSSGSGSIVTILTRSDGTLETEVQSTPSSANNLRRTSWRELVN
jgi:type IV pilus assembly protein PilY1